MIGVVGSEELGGDTPKVDAFELEELEVDEIKVEEEIEGETEDMVLEEIYEGDQDR